MGATPPGSRAARFAQYNNTVVEITRDDGRVVAVAPHRPAPAALTGLLPLYVVTAWNPGAERPGAATNAAANRSLKRRLEQAGASQILEARGVDADPRSDYYEDGFAVWDLTAAQVLDLAVEFRQDAIFEITAAGHRLLSCGVR
jgi:hypothetical protein